MKPRPDTSLHTHHLSLWRTSLLVLLLMLAAGPGQASVRSILNHDSVYE
ncbi:hypothetical protein MNBD_GAMMA15-2035, partial [hydrothermal vent metagenome]